MNGLAMTERDYFDVWNDLTPAQKAALCVLADGREHYCWKWASDPVGQAGKGCVNAVATGRLKTLKLARTIDYGGQFTGATIEITDIGQAVWDASVFDAERATKCVVCDHPIVHDDGFGWMHEDAPDGQSFDHLAVRHGADLVAIITRYLVCQPEQGGWPWEDHCEGIAGGILAALDRAGWQVNRG